MPVASLVPLLLERQALLALAVAGLATYHHIAFARPAAADQRNEVVHGQFFGRKSAVTMMADTGGALTLPPLGGAQLPRFLPLAPERFLGYNDQERARLHGQ